MANSNKVSTGRTKNISEGSIIRVCGKTVKSFFAFWDTVKLLKPLT